jgi:hypothetical protein
MNSVPSPRTFTPPFPSSRSCSLPQLTPPEPSTLSRAGSNSARTTTSELEALNALDACSRELSALPIEEWDPPLMYYALDICYQAMVALPMDPPTLFKLRSENLNITLQMYLLHYTAPNPEKVDSSNTHPRHG